jgi:alginate O-acetyltransferase complex protein AlgI
MIFTSLPFVVFFIVILALSAVSTLPGPTKALGAPRMAMARRLLLLLGSYFFYGWWDWRFCFLLLGLTLTAYLTALRMESGGNRKLYVAVGAAVPLIILAVFKYANFFVGSFVSLFGLSDPGALKIILPLGISFYTFQSMSYTIDVYRGKLPATRDFFKFALYVAFFPQLISGPIVKASVFLPQIDEDRKPNMENLCRGLQLILFGLAKKVVLADRLSILVNQVYAAPAAFSSGTVILAVVSYSLQLYFDFSGYSDMAIGIAKCFGYDLPRNFNMPYISRNVSEFWKRWHISLSSWLMEYLYFSLGGNRKGKGRTYLNLMLTMALGGLWHGASWNFIVWGLMHGAALCIHKLYLSLRGINPKTHKDENPITNLLKMAATFVVVSVAWVFFRADNWSLAIQVLGRAFSWQPGITHHYIWSYITIAVTLICTVIALFAGKKPGTRLFSGELNGFYPVMNLTRFWALVIVFFAAGLIFGLAYTGANPFIYFQF